MSRGRRSHFQSTGSDTSSKAKGMSFRPRDVIFDFPDETASFHSLWDPASVAALAEARYIAWRAQNSSSEGYKSAF
jgi:hypothetical protein